VGREFHGLSDHYGLKAVLLGLVTRVRFKWRGGIRVGSAASEFACQGLVMDTNAAQGRSSLGRLFRECWERIETFGRERFTEDPNYKTLHRLERGRLLANATFLSIVQQLHFAVPAVGLPRLKSVNDERQ